MFKNVKKIIDFIAIFLLLSCQPAATQKSKTTSTANWKLSLECKQEILEEDIKVNQSATLSINNIDLSIRKSIAGGNHTDGSKSISGWEIDTTINKVFDFNRVSPKGVYVVTNPSTKNSRDEDKKIIKSEKIRLLVVSYDSDKDNLVVREDETQKEILNITGCNATPN